ncbi:unnamed protein product, partial [Iphiclides podalirius]
MEEKFCEEYIAVVASLLVPLHSCMTLVTILSIRRAYVLTELSLGLTWANTTSSTIRGKQPKDKETQEKKEIHGTTTPKTMAL